MPRLDAELKLYKECGISFEADSSCSSPRKTAFYFSPKTTLTRSMVLSILSEYVTHGEPACCPVKCIDVLASAGTNGLIWKSQLADKVDVKINAPNPASLELIEKNASRNGLRVETSSNDPCIVLYERGYNFIYLDCTNDASHYLDAAFRNISRKGVLVVSCKDDCSMHGNSPDVALRRYSGRITRCLYYHELGIRLMLAAIVRTAAKYNKSIEPLCCFMDKNIFTIAVRTLKGPELANKTVENIRLLKHCMICEERKFYPISNGFPMDGSKVPLDCACASTSPSSHISLELGPLWAGPIFDVKFLEGMLQQGFISNNIELKSFLTSILNEAQCPRKTRAEEEDLSADNIKRPRTDIIDDHPPFYYNIHKHHPRVDHLVGINKIIEGLKTAGYRASKTHFDRLAIRTDAPLSKFLEIMKNLYK